VGLLVAQLREERRLRVFENRGRRRVFGSKRDEVRGDWRKLHTEELSDIYISPNTFRVIKSRKKKELGRSCTLLRSGEMYKGFGGEL